MQVLRALPPILKRQVSYYNIFSPILPLAFHQNSVVSFRNMNSAKAASLHKMNKASTAVHKKAAATWLLRRQVCFLISEQETSLCMQIRQRQLHSVNEMSCIHPGNDIIMADAPFFGTAEKSLIHKILDMRQGFS